MVSHIEDFVTKDGAKVRAYTIAFAQSRLNTSRMHGIRIAARDVLVEKASSLTYDQFTQEAVHGKIASDIYNSAKKVSNLRHVGIRKTKLVMKPSIDMPTESAPEAVEAIS